MCWKRVKPYIAYLFEKINPRQWSIVKQLALLYTASTIVIMLVIFCLLYMTLQNSLYKVSAQFLTSEYQLLQNLMQRYPQNKTMLEQQVILQPTNIKSANQYYIRILDVRQASIIQTPGMSEVINIHEFPSVSVNTEKPFSIFHWHSSHEKPLLLLSGQIKPVGAKAPFQVQLALITDREEVILQDYWKMFVVVTIFGTLIATLLGIMLARKSMMPLKNIMRTAGHINTRQLHGRLIPDNWPKEFTVLAQNFNNMLDRLEKSFEQLTRFSADLAHELRTPISNLKGEAEICLTKERSLEEYRYVLESSLEEYDRLSRMIEGLLFLARAEDPHMEISCTEINLGNLFESIFEYYLPIAEENKIELTYTGKAMVWANELLMQRALHNIISNAVRYTPPEGKISANIETLPSGEVSIQLSDTGLGIAKEQLPYIFDRFYRTDNARAQTSGGSGLGLAIVKSIMDLHHGRIKVSSESGIGTIATLIFPPMPSKIRKKH